MARKSFRPTTTTAGQPYVAMPLGVHTGGMPTRSPSTPTLAQMKSVQAEQNYQDVMASGGNAGSV
jgi:hypothetical protein